MKVNIGKGIELDVALDKLAVAGFEANDLSKLPVLSHIIYIGLRNVLMDSHASVTREESGDDYVEQSRAVAEKKLAALYNGDVRTQSTRTGDPVRAEAIRIASKKLTDAWRAKGRKVADIDSTELRRAALTLIESTPAITEQARANVEKAKAIDVTVDDDMLASLTATE